MSTILFRHDWRLGNITKEEAVTRLSTSLGVSTGATAAFGTATLAGAGTVSAVLLTAVGAVLGGAVAFLGAERACESWAEADRRSVAVTMALGILGLPEISTLKDLNRRYRQVSLFVHPDRNGGDVQVAQAIFQKTQAAHELLVAEVIAKDTDSDPTLARFAGGLLRVFGVSRTDSSLAISARE